MAVVFGIIGTDVLFGTSDNDRTCRLSGANTLCAGPGFFKTLFGGSGSDSFAFSADESGGLQARITDFVSNRGAVAPMDADQLLLAVSGGDGT